MQDHYEVVQVGWQADRRVHGSIIHIDILDGKVWTESLASKGQLGNKAICLVISYLACPLKCAPAKKNLSRLSGFRPSRD